MTKNLRYLHNKINHSTLVVVWLFIWLASFTVGEIRAADVTITATIPDTEAPSVPILIAPADGALLSDSTPTFQWYESTDNLNLSHYVFYLDGDASYGNIPLIATETSTYTLTYDSLNGIYSLTPKNTISDASHTWRVVAVDYANLSSSSDTWDFRIDTLTPSFTLTKIGDVSTNISAANPSSVPDSPVLIFQNDATANEPTLLAAGEANSTVKLTVTIPGDDTQTFTTTINAEGLYELKLGILPRDTDIRLDFVITDLAGHVSVLEGVYFRITLQYWPTPTSTITPSPSMSVSPTLSVTGVPTISGTLTRSPTPSISLSPSPTATPSGLVPIIPPREIIHEGVDEAIDLLPEETGQAIRAFLTSSFWRSLSIWFNALLLLLFYSIGFVLLLSKFITTFSGVLLKRIVALLFPHIHPPTDHLVYEHRSTNPSPLVKVELVDEQNQVLDVQISNRLGNFAPFATDYLRQWRLRVQDSNFYFPIGDEPPKSLSFWQFYQGQVFDHEHYQSQPILIPTLQAAGQERLPWLERVRIAYLYLLEYPHWFAILLLILSLIFAIRYPSWWNYLVVGFYGCMWAWKLLMQSKLNRSFMIHARLGEQLFTGNLVLSMYATNPTVARSLILPCMLAESKLISHDFEVAALTCVSKGLTVHHQKQPAIDHNVIFTGKNQKIDLQINKN